MFGKKKDEGENFWISYTDMMTGMVTILLIIVATSIYTNFELHTKLTEDEKEGLIKQTMEVVKVNPNRSGVVQTQFTSFFGKMEHKLTNIFGRDSDWKNGFTFEPDKQLISIRDIDSNTPLFEQDKDQPNPAFLNDLQRQILPLLFHEISSFNNNMDLKNEGLELKEIRIEGHTNSDGSNLHNLDLSNRRALEVLKVIYQWAEKNGHKSIFERYFISVGYGESKLIKDSNTKVENKSKSKRIEIKFIIDKKDK